MLGGPGAASHNGAYVTSRAIIGTTPPFGINLFVIHGIRGRGTLSDVEIGSSPFVIALLLMIGLICLYPDIAMWLPRIVG